MQKLVLNKACIALQYLDCILRSAALIKAPTHQHRSMHDLINTYTN